ncbi:hypothetical protein AAHK20_25490 [Trinickia sp. YCB016]
MYIEQPFGYGRKKRVWVGRRPVVLVARGARQMIVMRPRLTRLFGFKVRDEVVLTRRGDGSITLEKALGQHRSRFGGRRAAAVARTAGRAKRA